MKPNAIIWNLIHKSLLLLLPRIASFPSTSYLPGDPVARSVNKEEICDQECQDSSTTGNAFAP